MAGKLAGFTLIPIAATASESPGKWAEAPTGDASAFYQALGKDGSVCITVQFSRIEQRWIWSIQFMGVAHPSQTGSEQSRGAAKESAMKALAIAIL